MIRWISPYSRCLPTIFIIVTEQTKSLVYNDADGGASKDGGGCFITEYKLQCT